MPDQWVIATQIVVAHTVGPIVVEAWITNPNVTGLIFANLPGQESGNALADILWGDVNPSGRLPYTVAKSINDYAAKVDYTSFSLTPIQISYSEGLFIDYRHFDQVGTSVYTSWESSHAHTQAGIVPRYEFGFGLSYTTFTYSDLSISGTVGSYTPPSGQGSSLSSS
jgi:beta-glucosidase